VLELRVHGVRGTSVESMLGATNVEQVAGDDLTGFHRIAGGGDPPFRRLKSAQKQLCGPRSHVAVEAYSWGALTSGARGRFAWLFRVLWVFLLPFALVNMASWARSSAGEPTRSGRLSLRVVRLSALMLTILAVVTACFVGMDLLAWQCFRTNTEACPVLPDWLGIVARFEPAERIAIGSVVPLVALLVLVIASNRSVHKYEAVVEEGVEDQPWNPNMRTSVLDHPLMWMGESRTQRLMRLHVAAGLSTIVLYSGVHLYVVGERSWALIATTLLALALVPFVLVRTFTVDTDDLESERAIVRAKPRARSSNRGLVVHALVVMAAHILALWRTEVGPLAQYRDWFGGDWWFLVPLAGLTGMHIAVFACRKAPMTVRSGTAAVLVVLGNSALIVGALLLVPDLLERHPVRAAGVGAVVVWAELSIFHWCESRRDENRQVAWGGAAASMLLGGATVVALVFTSALTIGAAEFLNGGQSLPDLATSGGGQPRAVSQERPRLYVQGDVELDGVRVTRDRGDVTVSSGTIRVDGLTAAPYAGVAEELPSVKLEKAELVIPTTATVTLDGACVGREPGRRRDLSCTPDSPTYRSGGELDVAWGRITVDAPRRGVSVTVADPPQTPLVLPQILVWTPLMQSAVVVVGLPLVALLVIRYRRGAGRLIADSVHLASMRVAAMDPDGVVDPHERDATGHRKEPAAKKFASRISPMDAESVADARRTAGMTHRAERVLDAVGAVTSFFGLGVLAAACASASLAQDGIRAPWVTHGAYRPWATIALWIAIGASSGLIALGAQVRTSPTARRNVGILWDLTTFWPRAAHPFGPPCYAERVVPEIITRVRWALDDDPSRLVILSGHSQGSLIAVAAACRMRGREHQLRLLTYGSQIRELYGRVFPAAAGPHALGYIPTKGPAALGEVGADVPELGPIRGLPPGVTLRHRLDSADHWVNLVRPADPIGYRVYSDQDSHLDVPTLEVRPFGSGDPGSRVLTHGGYQHSPEYRWVVSRWTNETFQGPATGPVDADPLPPSLSVTVRVTR